MLLEISSFWNYMRCHLYLILGSLIAVEKVTLSFKMTNTTFFFFLQLSMILESIMWLHVSACKDHTLNGNLFLGRAFTWLCERSPWSWKCSSEKEVSISIGCDLSYQILTHPIAFNHLPLEIFFLLMESGQIRPGFNRVMKLTYISLYHLLLFSLRKATKP